MFAAIVGQSFAIASHPYNLEVNGNDLIAFMQWPSLRLEMAGPGSNGSMTLTLEDKDSTIATINEWDEVRFIEWAAPTFPILFGGFVQSVRYVAWAAGGRSIVLTCVGYGILLDKKAVPSFTLDANPFLYRTLVSLINRHGGVVTGVSVTSGPDTSPGFTVAAAGGHSIDFYSPVVVSDNQTLRAVIEELLGNALYTLSIAPFTIAGQSSVYWVDAYRRLVWYPDVPAEEDPSQKITQYYGDTVPYLTVDEIGTQIIDEISYEREDTDRLTSAYVVGGAAPGTGYYRGAALERAGDLETIILASDSLVAGDIVTKGGAAVQQTSSATARGETVIGSNTALDIFPGINVRVTSPRAGLTASDWRVTSTTVEWRSSTYREYTVGFGGNIPGRSAMRRTGRFSIRNR